MFGEIAMETQQAAKGSNKIAMFHFQVLKHAHELASTNLVEFFRTINVPLSYATESRKMLSLARLIRNKGMQLR